MQKKILVSLLVFAYAIGALAETRPVHRKDCQDAIYRAVAKRFKIDSKWSSREISRLANFDADAEEQKGKSPNVLLFTVNTNDVYDWDGLAEYEVTVKATPAECRVMKITLGLSEGI